MKKLITILLLLPVMATAQDVNLSHPINKLPRSDTPLIKLPITDSTAVISLRDLKIFITLLNRIPHEDYIKLTPEAVVTELWNWKLNQKKK